MVRTMTVSFLLLDEFKKDEMTAQYLEWAHTADTAWDSELTTDRVVTVAGEVRKAQTAMQKDSKFLLRKVLGARIPTPTPYTQAFWISGAEAAPLTNISIVHVPNIEPSAVVSFTPQL